MSTLPSLLAFEKTVEWLHETGLARPTSTMVSTNLNIEDGLFAQPASKNPRTQKAQRKTQRELEDIEKKTVASTSISPKAVYDELQLVKQNLLHLDLTRYPADAIAFYRPFHFSSPDEWGIYFDVDKLLGYTGQLFSELKRNIVSFDADSLLTTCFCEIFQHEYFHHITECAATTMEVVLNQFGQRRPIFTSYWHERFRSNHPHSPLEEALANAYAYNSLTFLSRIKTGLKTTRIKVYQTALIQHWKKEPAGYRDAANYIDGGYVSGAADLMKLLLHAGDSSEPALELIAKEVLLNGNATFFAKPQIPVYFCGSMENLEIFNQRVPAPVESYSNLYWPSRSTEVDAYFAQRRRENRNESANE